LKLTKANTNLAIHRPNTVNPGQVSITDIRWVVPRIKPSVEMTTALRESVTRKNKIPISFSSRNDQHTIVTADVQEYEWMINRSSGIEKPRWIIVGFQSNKKTTQEQNQAVLDHLN
jgi:hypothetical protein